MSQVAAHTLADFAVEHGQAVVDSANLLIFKGASCTALNIFQFFSELVHH
jgi:hypothetical protein